jgi:hypothetical protein
MYFMMMEEPFCMWLTAATLRRSVRSTPGASGLFTEARIIVISTSQI